MTGPESARDTRSAGCAVVTLVLAGLDRLAEVHQEDQPRW
jgi:hypothetical protein